MKSLILIIFLINTAFVFAGQYVPSNLYSPHAFVQGIGINENEAELDANSSIPAGFKQDKSNSPGLQCTNYGYPSGDEESPMICDNSKGENFVLITMPVVKSSL